ncbi:NAD-dependent epimerase/dehydratase family protein [Oceanimonas sp. CHS3-5]|uniref:NAD-dependent epimerase/dehydratase family protein n=1 Tax=Oceanimonas sp. CHS3-5 TaxID=3068186 RepID=UPI00273D7A80|nr:NAD-dependent epimerase/dehydratase family protein [Oceanimonas sp. CHS3-5]MDP5292270.1 NAD-dependent epimerase/dehydratase family protein [Oceanimonas sp. CHS3-5]
MKILVIGGTGFIGRHLSPYLAKNNHVLVMARNPIDTKISSCSESNISYVKGDITDRDQVFAAMEGMDYVIHLASSVIPSTSNADPVFDVQTNLVGALNILDAAVEHKIKKLVFLSSGGTVYGEGSGVPFKEDAPTNPICSYGIVKLAIEKYIKMYNQLYDVPYAILRVSNPYGPGQLGDKPLGVVSIFLDRIKRETLIEIWGDGSTSRDFIHIDDVLSAIDSVLWSPNNQHLLNIGSGKLVSILELINLISEIVSKRPNLSYKPSRSFDVESVHLNIDKARSEIDWTPKIDLYDGISLMASLRNNI